MKPGSNGFFAGSGWLLAAALFFAVLPMHAAAQDSSQVVVFSEEGFPAADSALPTAAELKTLFPNAVHTRSAQLAAELGKPGTQLLILPYGSSFPEEAWPAIFSFAQHGGNLLVLGGRPFTRSAYHDASGWRLRDYSVRFAKQLRIDQYQVTPGSEGLEFEVNSDLPLQLPRFAWRAAFSPIISLSSEDLYHRGGSAGAIDARLDALAWGTREGRRMAAPAIQIDHLRSQFTGSRWIFLSAELPKEFFSSPDAARVIAPLVREARNGSEEFTVHPTLPLYLPDEPVELTVHWGPVRRTDEALFARITVSPAGSGTPGTSTMVPVPADRNVIVDVPNPKGFYTIKAELLEGGRVRALYHSGFWIRDEEFLHSGPRLSVNHDYFEVDGHPLGVVGTTYMASDVQRLYFDHPNPYVWDRDLAQISGAGLNMIRTGWWTGWDKFCDENGQPYERTLRTLEAYLMTARQHGLPVQFNIFAFLPEVLGGENAYLDPEAVRRQRTLIGALATRFHDVPFLAWDLINEPSFSKHLWRTRPNGDAIELARWNEWLSKRYPDRAALAAAWNLPQGATQSTIPVPTDEEFQNRSMYSGPNSLKVYDYYVFAQENFAGWVRQMRDTIRSAGSKQLITVGQDEGGFEDRLSPTFFGESVDFSTNHSWWQNDSLLWDSMVAKQPGQALLIQETGLQRELTMDEIARRTPDNEAALFERKVATAFIQASGAIEWLWNTNSYMTEGNEVPIGALRADATEKPEATVMRDFAKFAKSASESLKNAQQPAVAIVTSQAAQFSVVAQLQIAAQRNAVRALTYYDHIPGYLLAENQIEKLGTPKLVILPSAQALNEKTWQALLKYVDGGGNLLVTGPVSRDEHWQLTDRISALQVEAQTEPLTYHNAEIRIKDRVIPLSFDLPAQSWLESLRFGGGVSFKELSHGKGRIFWAAYPVELAEGSDAAAALYSHVLGQLQIMPAFEVRSKVSPGVLIYPTVLQDAMLYVITSESADPADIDLRDKLTGARLTIHLASQRAALAVIRKADGSITAKYGF